MAKSVLTHLDFGGTARIQNLPAPVSGNEPARLADLNSAMEGLAWKANVRAASTANINLQAPGAAINGIAMEAGDSFLAKDQTNPAENGPYLWNGAATPATRRFDANTARELERAVIGAEEGTSGGAWFRQQSINFVLGTDPVVWVPFLTGAATATETISGIAEIATQAEVDGGTDDARFVTPKKLAEAANRKLKFAALIGDDAATSFTLNHNFNTRDVIVQVFRTSGSFDEIMTDVERTTVNSVTVKFAAAPAASAFRAVITG